MFKKESFGRAALAAATVSMFIVGGNTFGKLLTDQQAARKALINKLILSDVIEDVQVTPAQNAGKRGIAVKVDAGKSFYKIAEQDRIQYLREIKLSYDDDGQNLISFDVMGDPQANPKAAKQSIAHFENKHLVMHPLPRAKYRDAVKMHMAHQPMIDSIYN